MKRIKLTQMGFLFEGVLIKNPYRDESDRINVDPYLYYGKHYMLSDFFHKESKLTNTFLVIHLPPEYDPMISLVKEDFFCGDNGFNLQERKEVMNLPLDEKIQFEGLIIERIL